MFVLGVTGGIGSGKSAATEIFSSLGIKIVDADVLSRVPVQKGESGLLEIEKRYGKEILLSSGDLDRKKLREIIFEKEEESTAPPARSEKKHIPNSSISPPTFPHSTKVKATFCEKVRAPAFLTLSRALFLYRRTIVLFFL